MEAPIAQRRAAAADLRNPPEPVAVEAAQLSAPAILGIWAAATVPMGVAAWIAAPLLAAAMGGPAALPKALLVSLSLGLIWQFVLVVGLVYREQRTLRWSTARQALWLRAPRSPRTGRTGGRLWAVVVLMIAGLSLVEAVPAIPHPLDRDLGPFLASPAGHAFLHGAWGWLGVIAVLLVFNTILGEELLFRGLLLPRMSRVFGRFDWEANGVLFALYHVHVPWVVPVVLVDAVFVAYPARRYRSAVISILAHSAQSVVVLVLATLVVLS